MVLAQERSQETQVQETQATCCHHWIIETADGPVSLGYCQFCFETKEFKNSLEDWSFFKETVRVRNEFGVSVPGTEEPLNS
ncbi:MAG: hypothetical protein IIC97_10670 [Chloroflexi bacterium]|nr:hypothetical protein [Chloroflexota bacterium]